MGKRSTPIWEPANSRQLRTLRKLQRTGQLTEPPPAIRNALPDAEDLKALSRREAAQWIGHAAGQDAQPPEEPEAAARSLPILPVMNRIRECLVLLGWSRKEYHAHLTALGPNVRDLRDLDRALALEFLLHLFRTLENRREERRRESRMGAGEWGTP